MKRTQPTSSSNPFLSGDSSAELSAMESASKMEALEGDAVKSVSSHKLLSDVVGEAQTYGPNIPSFFKSSEAEYEEEELELPEVEISVDEGQIDPDTRVWPAVEIDLSDFADETPESEAAESKHEASAKASDETIAQKK